MGYYGLLGSDVYLNGLTNYYIGYSLTGTKNLKNSLFTDGTFEAHASNAIATGKLTMTKGTSGDTTEADAAKFVLTA